MCVGIGIPTAPSPFWLFPFPSHHVSPVLSQRHSPLPQQIYFNVFLNQEASPHSNSDLRISVEVGVYAAPNSVDFSARHPKRRDRDSTSKLTLVRVSGR